MASNTDIVNRALQAFGSRTTVTDAELTNETSNEAKQANLVLTQLRDQLLRMAPWDCALVMNRLTYITSTPGTPENTSDATQFWARGQPALPWSYEFQYPVDCLRACWILPSTQSGYAGVPLTSAIQGFFPGGLSGMPVKFKVQIDLFYPVTAATVANGGTGHAVGDLITLAQAADGVAPVGAPAVLRVATVAAGVILTVTVVDQILDSETRSGGSYFAAQTNPVAQGSTTGSGISATFTLTFGAQGAQRVILTNEEYPALVYCKQITDPNVMDPLFVEAWVQVLGGHLCIALSGEKALANICISKANMAITEARKVDGNEGLTTNDITPDWIRVRGIAYPDGGMGPYSQGWDWGPVWSAF